MGSVDPPAEPGFLAWDDTPTRPDRGVRIPRSAALLTAEADDAPSSAAPERPEPAGVRFTSYAFLVLAASFTVPWYPVGFGMPSSIRWHHLGLVLFVVVAIGSRSVRHAAVRVVRRQAIFVWAAATWLSLLLVGRIRWNLGPGDPLNQLTYAVVGVLVAGFVLTAVEHPSWRVAARNLTLTGPVALVTFLVAFFWTARTGNIKVVPIVVDAVRTADPSVLQFRLFRGVFASGGSTIEARDNMRHEIFAWLIVAAWTSIAASGIVRNQRWVRKAALVCAVVTGALVIISVSRSALLASLIVLGVLALRPPFARRLVRRDLVVGFVLAIGFFALTVGGLSDVLYSRIASSDTQYSGRTLRLEEALHSIESSPIFGDGTHGSHNIILDGWMIAGIFCAAAAAVMFFGLLRAVFQLVRSVATAAEFSWTDLAIVGIGVMPTVRLVTAGGGVLHPGGWIAVGIFGGFWTWRQAALRAARRRANLPSANTNLGETAVYG